LGKWEEIPESQLIGDAVGLASANVVSTLAGGTLPVANLVTLDGVQTVSNKDITATALAVTGDTTANGVSAATLTVSGTSIVNDLTINGDTNAASILTPLMTVNGTARITELTVFEKSTLQDVEVTAFKLPGGVDAQVLTSNATGDASWQDPPTGVSTATPNTLVQRDASAGSAFGALQASTIQLTTGGADGKVLTSDLYGTGTWQDPPAAATGVSTATPNTLAKRDASAGCAFGGVEASNIKLTTGAAASKVLTSDASGNATWQNIPPSTTPAVYAAATVYQPGDLVTYTGQSLYKMGRCAKIRSRNHSLYIRNEDEIYNAWKDYMPHNVSSFSWHVCNEFICSKCKRNSIGKSR
jgi:hypothetical protein